MTDLTNVDTHQYRDDWALALMSRGLVVRLVVGRWHGEAQLKAENLGLKFVNEETVAFAKKYINLGRYQLLPPDIANAMRSIERRARKNLEHYSFNTVWGRFVPLRAFDEWKRNDDDLRAEFMEQAKKFSSEYEAIVSFVKWEYRKLGRDVWARLYPNDTGGPTASFLEEFTAQIVAQIPSREEIMGKFRYDVVYLTIPVPSVIYENVAKARNIERESEVADVQSEIEIQARRRMAEEYVSKKVEIVDGFLRDTVKFMRKEIKELCNIILSSLGRLNKGNEPTTTQKNKINKMIDHVKLLNFSDDEEITKLMGELKAAVSRFPGECDSETIKDKLTKIVELGSDDFIPKDFNPTIGYLDID